MQKDECNLLHVYNWIQICIFIYYDAKVIGNNEFEIKLMEVNTG